MHYREVFIIELPFFKKALHLIEEKINNADELKQISTCLYQTFNTWLENTIKTIEEIVEDKERNYF